MWNKPSNGQWLEITIIYHIMMIAKRATGNTCKLHHRKFKLAVDLLVVAVVFRLPKPAITMKSKHCHWLCFTIIVCFYIQLISHDVWTLKRNWRCIENIIFNVISRRIIKNDCFFFVCFFVGVFFVGSIDGIMSNSFIFFYLQNAKIHLNFKIKYNLCVWQNW